MSRYNSEIYTSTSVNDFAGIVASTDFLNGDSYSLSSFTETNTMIYDSQFEQNMVQKLKNSASTLEKFQP